MIEMEYTEPTECCGCMGCGDNESRLIDIELRPMGYSGCSHRFRICDKCAVEMANQFFVIRIKE
jgi:hypothetical protein